MFDSESIAAFQTYFVVGILIFVRVISLFSTAPFFSHPGIPTQAKIFTSVVIAIAMTMTFGEQQPTVTFELFTLVGLVFKEFFVGALLGFASFLPFFAAFIKALVTFEFTATRYKVIRIEDTNGSIAASRKRSIK